MKRTYQPKNLRRIRKLGFRARNATKHGRNVLKRRMLKGRQRLTASREYNLLRKKPRARIR